MEIRGRDGLGQFLVTDSTWLLFSVCAFRCSFVSPPFPGLSASISSFVHGAVVDLQKNKCFLWNNLFSSDVFSPLMSDTFQIGFSPASWESLGDCLSPAFTSEPTWSDNLLRCVFNTNKHEIYNMGGLASAPSNLTSACVIGPILSLRLSQISFQAEHLLPSTSINLRVLTIYYKKYHLLSTYGDLPGKCKDT